MFNHTPTATLRATIKHFTYLVKMIVSHCESWGYHFSYMLMCPWTDLLTESNASWLLRWYFKLEVFFRKCAQITFVLTVY